MKSVFVFLFFNVFTGLVIAQVVTNNASLKEVERIEITGKIVVQSEDKEAITVFNSSSNKGTITDEEGRFSIEVALNDNITFAALQFKDFSIVIDERIMRSKQLTVFLVEEVNKLDEIIILPYDLTGSLLVDLNSVRTYNVDMDSIYSGLTDQDDYKFSADYLTGVNNPAVEDQLPYMDNGLNIINLVGLFLRPFGSKTNVEKRATLPNGTLVQRYDAEFLETNFKIPRSRSEEFIVYVEERGIDSRLWQKDRELELLEFLYQESILFLNSSIEKK